MPALIVRKGPLSGRRVTVTRELIVGREGADLVIEDARVSRRHAAFRVTEQGLEVQDLGSTNGTFVDGARIEGPTPVGDGAVIAVGGSQFVARVDRAPASVPAGATIASEAPAPAAPASVAPAPAAPAALAGPVAPVTRRSGGLATRSWVPVILSFGTLALVLAALVVYFAAR